LVQNFQVKFDNCFETLLKVELWTMTFLTLNHFRREWNLDVLQYRIRNNDATAKDFNQIT